MNDPGKNAMLPATSVPSPLPEVADGAATRGDFPSSRVEPAVELTQIADTAPLMRYALAVVGIGFLGFLAWAAFAPLEEGIPTPGTVAIDTKRKAVQHLQGGIVAEVLVTEGQVVAANQVLMRIDDASARALFEASRQRYLGLRALEGRLVAEQLGLPTIEFHRDLVAAATQDPLIRQHMTVQTQLLQSRRSSLAANLSALDEMARGQQGLIDGYGRSVESRARQRELLEKELKGVRNLVDEGYAPMTRQFELERALADNEAVTADLQSNAIRARSAILEVRQRAEALKSDYRKEIDGQLADVRRDVLAEAERFKAATEDLKRTEIRSPAAGQVVGLATQTVGAVVQPGQKLMDIVPETQSLIIEAQVAPNLIDRLRPGEPVDVRFSTFAHAPQLVVAGVVDSVSGDVLTDPVKQTPYYLTRIRVTEEGIRALGGHQLQPGMPVEMVVKTGERSLLTYLLHPLTKRISASMKEQ